MTTKKNKTLEFNADDGHFLNSARDFSVVDFECFLNRRDARYSMKKKKFRRSDVFKKKSFLSKLEALERDADVDEEDYIPINFVNN